MARELRVRSPVKTRHSGHGLPSTTTTSIDRKRKLDDTDLATKRRSTRTLPANNNDNPRKQKSSVYALWNSPLFVVAGLTELDFPQDRQIQNAPKEAMSAAKDDPSSAADDSDDGATWEKRWLESPSKRRKIERLSGSPASSPTAGSRGHSRNNSSYKSANGVNRLRRQIAKGRESSRSIYDETADTPPASQEQSRETTVRPSAPPHTKSEAASEPFSQANNADTQTGDPEIEDGEPLPENITSPRSTLSPAPSSPGQVSIDLAAAEALAEEEPVAAELDETESRSQTDPDYLEDSDLPPPLGEFQAPGPLDSYEDEAARILCTLFAPIPLPNRFIRPLTSHPPSSRSTATLLALAENAQFALKTWQDEYIRLDRKTAPVSLPIAKKPCTGGRNPADPAVFEAEKQKELYSEGSILAKAMGIVHPSTNRHKGANNTSTNDGPAGVAGKRELRRRRADNGVVDGLGISSDDAGAAKSKRARKPARKFETGQNNMTADAMADKEASVEPGVKRRRRNVQAIVEQPATTYLSGPRAKRVQALARNDESATSSPALTVNSIPQYATTVPYIPSAQAYPTQPRKISPAYHYNPQPDKAVAVPAPPVEVQPPVKVRAPTGAAAHKSRLNGKAPAAKTQAPKKEDKAPPEPIVPLSPASAAAAAEKKARAKSEKRSESMTAWWAARKKKAAEERIKEMHDRGEFHNGQWNVDTVKNWGHEADHMRSTQAAAAAAAAAANAAAMAPYMNGANPGFPGYMGPSGPQGHWGSSWPNPSMAMSAGANGMGYPYAPYGYQNLPQTLPQGMRYDSRPFVPQHTQHQPAPSGSAQTEQRRGLDTLSHTSGPPPRQSFSTSSVNQHLTPNHPFAQPTGSAAAAQPQGYGAIRPSSRHESPPRAQKQQGELSDAARRLQFMSGTGPYSSSMHDQHHRRPSHDNFMGFHSHSRYEDPLRAQHGPSTSRPGPLAPMQHQADQLGPARQAAEQGPPRQASDAGAAAHGPLPATTAAAPKPAAAVTKHRPWAV